MPGSNKYRSGNIKKNYLFPSWKTILNITNCQAVEQKLTRLEKISLHVLGADEGGGKHADDKSLNKAKEMLGDVSEGDTVLT